MAGTFRVSPRLGILRVESLAALGAHVKYRAERIGMNESTPSSAFVALSQDRYRATPLTRGPWDLKHQHAGPPIALVLGAIERVAAGQHMAHIARLTASLFRPIPIAELSIEVEVDYAGRNSAHISARLHAEGKEVARFS